MKNAKMTADHESAHAEIGRRKRFPVKSVSINPAPGTIQGARGICYVGRQAGQTEILQIPEILTAAKAQMLMAGRVSDELFHPDVPGGWEHDFEKLASLMPLDHVTLEMHRYCESHPGDTEGFYRKFSKPVVRLLKSKRGQRTIKALSDALLKAGTLSGMAAVSILEKAWGKPIARNALPASRHFSITEGGPNTYPDVLFNLGSYLRAMEEDAIRLRGDLPDEEENHLVRIRFHLRMLRLELTAKTKNRGRDRRQASVKADSLPESRPGSDGENNPET